MAEPSFFEDRPTEECGVFGIYAPGLDVARLSFFALFALQHRGQESAGIATSDGEVAYSHKGMGLVSQVFTEENLSPLVGHLAVGHTRYSTTGSSHIRNAQPYLIETLDGPLGVAFNGNLTNALELRNQLLQRGVGLMTTTDTELIVQLLASPPGATPQQTARPNGNGRGSDPWVARIRRLMEVIDGAYSLALLTRHAIYAVRDTHGLRPLCLGRLAEGYAIASESCALNTIGGKYVREIEPGEILRIDSQGLTSSEGLPPKKKALCSFEFVYFARPDSMLDGQVVHTVRQEMGRKLAEEAPAEADVVVAVPDSSVPAAIGYGQQMGLPYSEGLTKNRYIGRTFIQPDNHLRQQGVRLKFNALGSNLRGKRVVLVDDSIVRGNTSGPIVQLIREAGATEVHLRISSPPVRHPCFMGVDMATYKELIAHKLDVPAICERIGADSLDYLSLEGMLEAIRATTGLHDAHCTACFSGNYPLDIPSWLFDSDQAKMMLGQVWGT